MKNGHVIAIIGLSKNAGKTTFLNWYINNSAFKNFGVTSTGRDGEDIDLLTAKKKPKVFLPPDTLFTSFDYVSERNPSGLKVIAKLPFRVIGKNIWLYKALESIETEIVGPSTLNEQIELIKLFKINKCECVLIDGSIDRKSICLSDKIDEIALVIGAATGNINEITSQAEKIKLLSAIEIIKIKDYEHITCKTNKIVKTDIKTIYSNESFINDILVKQPEWLYLPGMITENSWQKLKKSFFSYKGNIILNHPINLNISLKELRLFMKEKGVSSRLNFPLKTVAINSYSPNDEHIDAGELRGKIVSIFNNIDVIDVKEIKFVYKK